MGSDAEAAPISMMGAADADSPDLGLLACHRSGPPRLYARQRSGRAPGPRNVRQPGHLPDARTGVFGQHRGGARSRAPKRSPARFLALSPEKANWANPGGGPIPAPNKPLKLSVCAARPA